MTSAPISLDAATEDSEFFKRLSHPARLAIVRLLRDAGETSVAEIEATLGITQPSLSQQLTELRNGGLIAPRRQGKNVYYSLADARVAVVLSAFAQTASGGFISASSGVKQGVVPVAAAMFARVGPVTSGNHPSTE